MMNSLERSKKSTQIAAACTKHCVSDRATACQKISAPREHFPPFALFSCALSESSTQRERSGGGFSFITRRQKYFSPPRVSCKCDVVELKAPPETLRASIHEVTVHCGYKTVSQVASVITIILRSCTFSPRSRINRPFMAQNQQSVQAIVEVHGEKNQSRVCCQ